MKIYFEDGPIVLGRYVPDFNFVVDAAYGLSNNEGYLDRLLHTVPDCAIYTNSLVAVHSKYCWNNDLNIPELYIRHNGLFNGNWVRVDQLTNRTLKQGHNFLKMYWSGEFSHEEGWVKEV